MGKIMGGTKGAGCQIREEPAFCRAFLGAEKDDISHENTFLWEVKTE
jgi:hypothetical protein